MSLNEHLKLHAIHVPMAIVVVTLTILSSWLLNSCNRVVDHDLSLITRVEAAEKYIARHEADAAHRDNEIAAINTTLDALSDKVDDTRVRLVRVEGKQDLTLVLIRRTLKEVE